MSTCRFCGKWEPNEHGLEPNIHYGTRHYAHADCGLRAKGSDFFHLLHDWQLEQFPALAAFRAGLYDVLCDDIRSRRAKRTTVRESA